MTSSKLTLAALATVLVAGTVAAPVLAADSLHFDSAFYVQQLRYDGVKAIDADDYVAGTFRALVELPNGHQQFEFFSKDSFQQVSPTGSLIGG